MPNLTLSRRARVTRTELTKRKTWRTADGSAEITEVRWLHPDGYGCYYLIVVKSPKLAIEQRRTRKAAERALAARINPTRKGKR